MSGFLRVLFRDLRELLQAPRGLLLVLVVPAVVVLLVGQLQVQPPELHTLVAAEAGTPATVERDLLLRLLDEAGSFRVTVSDSVAPNPLGILADASFDLLVQAEGPERWRIYTAETNPQRYVAIRAAAAGLERALPLVIDQARAVAADAASVPQDAGALGRQLAALGVASPGRHFAYYPAAADRAHAALPMTIALIACLLPFVLAAPGLVRERNARVLEVVLAAPDVGAAGYLAGRAVAAMVATGVTFLWMVLLAWPAYGIVPGDGLVALLPALIPALAASTLLGIATSSLARSEVQAATASAVWFLWLLLLSGVLYPLDHSGAAVRVLAYLSPLASLNDPVNAWMFGADPWPLARAAAAPLTLLALLALVAAAWAWRRLLRRL